MSCYCGSPHDYNHCCAPFHQGSLHAATPEQLMRSRFSAYVLQLVPYIARTYHSSKQSDQASAEIADFAQSAKFLSLQVIAASNAVSSVPAAEQAIDSGFVHFKVRFIVDDKLHLLEEHSRFLREQQIWSYLDGVLTAHPVLKISRNDLCPCGSGKKYKSCTAHWLNNQAMPNPARPNPTTA